MISLKQGQGIHQSGVWLHFFMPMEGGERYWTAKISVAGNVAYYCVSETLLGLLRQILEKGQTHLRTCTLIKSP